MRKWLCKCLSFHIFFCEQVAREANSMISIKEDIYFSNILKKRSRHWFAIYSSLWAIKPPELSLMWRRERFVSENSNSTAQLMDIFIITTSLRAWFLAERRNDCLNSGIVDTVARRLWVDNYGFNHISRYLFPDSMRLLQ